MKNSKGKLIEAFVDCSTSLVNARKSVEELTRQQEALACAISLDNELSDLILAGGIHTVNNRLVTLNRVTNSLEVKKAVASYNIESELTTEQMGVLENGK